MYIVERMSWLLRSSYWLFIIHIILINFLVLFV
jgi:hypothetical protein